MIIGSAGTPYEGGLFFFDLQLSFDYPQSPPQVFPLKVLSFIRNSPRIGVHLNLAVGAWNVDH